MGKKRKLLDPCNHLRVSSQDKNEECRVCGYEPMKKSHSVRNRSRFDGHYLNTAARSLVVPLTSSRVFKKASYITAKCHAVGISAMTAAHSKPHRTSGNLPGRKLIGGDVDENSKPFLVKGDGLCNKDLLHGHRTSNSLEKGTYGKVDDAESASQIDMDILLDESDQNQIRQLPLKPLFFEVPQEEEQQCIEREWIFSKIDSVFSGRPNNRGIVIHGSAGTGKTTIALYMVKHSCFGSKKNLDGQGNAMGNDVKKTENFRPFSRLVSHIVAYHFCQVDNRTTCLVPDFVHSVAAQICQAPALASYRMFLEENPSYLDKLSLNNCIISPSSAFVNGIIEPLIQLRKLKQLPSGYLILILDSLCEAESHRPYAGDTISSFLSKHILKIPSWFKFIVTVRSNQLDRLSLLPFQKISLDNMDDNIIHDLQDYIKYRFERISKLKNTVIANRIRTITDVNILPNLKYHLRELSGGCFLFLKLTLDLIEHGHLVIKSLSFKVLPISLSEVFMLHCNLRFPTQNAFGCVVPILSTCLAALNPLNLLEIYHSVNSLRANDNLPWVEFLRIFKNVQGLLVKRLDGTYMFFHSSFRDWLCGRDGGHCKFFCDTKTGHAAIAFRFIRVETPLGPLKTLDLAHHILKANVFKNTGAVTATNDFQTKSTQALWLLSSTPSITAALTSFSNIYNPNLTVSRLLLLAGASPDARSCLFNNAPMIVVCAAEANIGLMSLLLEYGADINAENDLRDTALHLASRRGHVQVAQYLIRHGARLSTLNCQNECPMVTATSVAQLEVLCLFLSQKWDECADMSISKEDALLQCLVTSCSIGHFQIAEFLCGHCTTINLSDRFSGETPLTAATKSNKKEIVTFLLEYGANPNTPNQRGTPPLICAAIEGHHCVMSALLGRGAKVNATDEYKRTALMASVRRDDVSGADILIRNEAILSSLDKDGMSSLGWACLRGNGAAFRYLLQFPFDINQTDVLGRTPLDLAAFSGSEEISQLLLDKDAALEHADLKGIRPLDRAIGCGHIALVQLFLRRGAKLGATTWTMAKGKPRIILSLLNKLLEDGKFLLEKDQLSDAEHRFQYALRKVQSADFVGDMKPVFSEMKTNLMLELLKCKKRLNEFEEVVKLADDIIAAEPSCHEVYFEKVTALISNRMINDAMTTLTIALETPGLNQDLNRKLVELKIQQNKQDLR